MNIDFDDLFKGSRFSQQPVPEWMLNYLNQSLNDNDLEYIDYKNGNCILVSKNKQVTTISGLHFKLSDSQKEILRDHHSISDILEYCYNAQEKIETLDVDEILVDGKKVKIEKFSVNPFKTEEIVSGKFCLAPYPFPKYQGIVLKNQGYTYALDIVRLPIKSVHVQRYASRNDKSLFIDILFDSQTKKSTISATYDFNLANSYEEKISCATIYNGLINGSVVLDGQDQPLTKKSEGNLISDETISLWKKIVKIEKIVGKSFDPRIEIQNEDILSIEKLYRTLSESQPFKTYEKLNCISLNSPPFKNSEKELDKEICINYVGEVTITLLGQKITLYSVIGAYHIMVSSIQKQSEEYKVYFSQVPNKKPFLSQMYFLDEESLQKYCENHNVQKELSDAKYILDFIYEDAER